MTYTAALCVAESDGFHQHEYRVGPVTVVEHLHTWVEEHLTRWPTSARIYVRSGCTETVAGDGLAEVWQQHTDQALPTVVCANNSEERVA